ncbi:med2p [Saccharomyces arboricola H-6]|uniref:Med2p n=1 Tax=Saccharomyces arboricola (strain H-6 / AS 2.3317 / CBS 10644) TaxID=1160507 RepID=J8Q3R0_SACAR|nr:med2p [Saccharomyces arboricola H-6]
MVVQNTSVSSVHTTNLVEQEKNTRTMTYKNKLTVCFDDILKVGAEMMMQQQLKNVQLDSYLVNGFSQPQQRLLKEKVKLFHGILDDLETSLSQSSSYVETLTVLGEEREKERQEAERKKAEEENLRKVKEQEELKKRQELEETSQHQQQQPREKEGLGINFTTTSSMMGANGTRQNNQEPGSLQPSNQTEIESTNVANNGATFPPLTTTQNRGQQGQPSDGMFSDLNSMDISMFSGLDNTSFEPTAFNAPVDGTKDLADNNLVNNYNDLNVQATDNTNNNNSSDSIKNTNGNNNDNNNDSNNDSNNSNNNDNNNNIDDDNDNNNNDDRNSNKNTSNDTDNISSNGNNNSNNITNNDLQTINAPNSTDNPPPADNGEEYLTLNDFNDLNIDWSNTGDNGELDLSGFNI